MFNIKLKDLKGANSKDLLTNAAKALRKLGAKHNSAATATPFFFLQEHEYNDGVTDVLFISGKLSKYKDFINEHKNDKNSVRGYAFMRYDESGAEVELVLQPTKIKGNPKPMEKELFRTVKKAFKINITDLVEENPALDAAAENAQEDDEQGDDINSDKIQAEQNALALQNAEQEAGKIKRLIEKIKAAPHAEENQNEKKALLREIPKLRQTVQNLPASSPKLTAFVALAEQFLQILEAPSKQGDQIEEGIGMPAPNHLRAQKLLDELVEITKQLAALRK